MFSNLLQNKLDHNRLAKWQALVISSNIQLQTMLIPKQDSCVGHQIIWLSQTKRAHISDSDVMHLNMSRISSMQSTNSSHIKSSSAQGSCSKYHQMLWELAHEETLLPSTCPSIYSRTPCPKVKTLKPWDLDTQNYKSFSKAIWQWSTCSSNTPCMHGRAALRWMERKGSKASHIQNLPSGQLFYPLRNCTLSSSHFFPWINAAEFRWAHRPPKGAPRTQIQSALPRSDQSPMCMD